MCQQLPDSNNAGFIPEKKSCYIVRTKNFPYVAQRKTRTRLMSSFKDCLIGDASFSRCLANHGNCKLLELSHQKHKRASFSLCVTRRQQIHAGLLHTLHDRYTHRGPQATCVPPACIMRLAATFAD